MLSREDAAHLEHVRAQTEDSLRDVIGPHRDVALLDAPALINVGDSMIWEGQLAYMRRMGYRVRYISDMQSYDPRRLRRALPDGGAVLLRGGGNFGDIWVGHQNFRERVARDLPEMRIVQLTQSVMFREPARAAVANDALGSHPDFTLLVRDHQSFERAAGSVPAVSRVMSFDMALGWTPGEPAAGTRDRAVVIARDDREASSGLLEAATGWGGEFPVHVTDWVRHADHPKRWHRTRDRLKVNGKWVARFRSRGLPAPTLPQAVIEADIAYLNEWNVRWAVDLFGTAKAMVVDRLHAHVLASLMGIPHVVLDNDHGKISTVFDAYTGQFSTAHYATSPGEAFQKLRHLMAE